MHNTKWPDGRNSTTTMTWAELKEAIEKAGVKDDDKIWYIDICFPEQDYFDQGDIQGVMAMSKDDERGWGIG